MRQLLDCLATRFTRPGLGLLLAAITLAALVDTALTVTGTLQTLNSSIATATYELRQPWVDSLMLALTYLGWGPTLLVIAAAVAAWMMHEGNRFDALLLLGSAVVAQLAIPALKLAVGQPRPNIVPRPLLLEPLYDYGYPSGHALGSMVVLGLSAIVICDLVDRPRLCPALLAVSGVLIAGIGLSRVYLGTHWVNDVIGGYLYGALILLVAYALHLCGRDRRAHPERADGGNPGED